MGDLMIVINNKKYRIKWRNVIILLFILISLIGIIYSGINLLRWVIDNNKTKTEINNIEEKVDVEEVNDSEETEIIEPEEKPNEFNPYWDYIKMNLIDVDFSELNKMLTYLKEHQMRVNEFNDNLYLDKHGYNKMQLRHCISTDRQMQYCTDISDSIAEIVDTDDEIEFAKKILLAKVHPWGGDSPAYDTDTMKDIVELYKQNKEGVSAVIDLKKDDDTPLFTKTDDIKSMSEIYLKDKDSVISAITSLKNSQNKLSSDDISDFVIAISLDKDLTNYWGYDPICFFAPHTPYLHSNDISEIKNMVKIFQIKFLKKKYKV